MVTEPITDTGRMPTFLVIGAMKAGTTALYAYLDQHPSVYMSPVKEPNFFAFEGEPPAFQAPIDQGPEGINRTSITDLAAYRRLFADAPPGAARGEASHWYLYWPAAPARIQHHLPEAQLVALLRNPVERAYSEFLHFVRDGHEPLTDFAEALDAEPGRIARGWALGRYVDRGRYHQQLQRYTARFDPDQLRVYLFDDFIADPEAVLRDLFAFLDVDPNVDITASRRVNKSGVPQRRWLHYLLTAAQPLRETAVRWLPERVVDWANALKNQNLEKPPMDSAVRARLVDIFRPEVRRLETLIDRDLSHWLEP